MLRGPGAKKVKLKGPGVGLSKRGRSGEETEQGGKNEKVESNS